ncbi:MAG: nucleotidyltransferase family protein [Rubrivivax sp.]|nr:nucleotidyltransferase family protein [Pyrinomonadaceae bacterium]
MFSQAPFAHGHAVAAILAGAWRAAPPDFVGSIAELEEVAPLLEGSGAAALGWWKIRHTILRESCPARGFQQAYRFQTLQAALREQEVAKVFARLEAAGVDALLVKGWASARLYPEQGLRPSGDIDLCVSPKHLARASHALEGARVWVDLHEGFGEDRGLDFDGTYERAERLKIDGANVHVLAPEDHLRLLCLHFLRHGAWRPLWLCDVSASIEGEGRATNFDWARVFGSDKRRARWVACAVGLAEKLLGASTAGTPFERAAKELPHWLAPEVLKQWATPFAAMQAPMRYRAPMRKYLRRPGGVWRDLLRRWPNPIEATLRVGGPLNELPRWPFQLANCLKRTTRFLTSANKAATRV